MSRTTIHKQKGKWRGAFQYEMPCKLRLYFFRKNSEFSYFVRHRILKKEKILNKDFQNEIFLYHDRK